MELNYMWEHFTWTKRDVSGIKNVIQGEQLGTSSQKPYVIALTEHLIFWVVSLSSGKQL